MRVYGIKGIHEYIQRGFIVPDLRVSHRDKTGDGISIANATLASMLKSLFACGVTYAEAREYMPDLLASLTTKQVFVCLRKRATIEIDPVDHFRFIESRKGLINDHGTTGKV